MGLGDYHSNHGSHLIILVIHHTLVDSVIDRVVIAVVLVADIAVVAVMVHITAAVLFLVAVAVIYAEMGDSQGLPHQILLHIQRFQRHA